MPSEPPAPVRGRYLDALRAVALQALSDTRSWHRWQIGQAIGDVRTMQVHESAIAWLDELIAANS